ncbi:hypothetical protein [Rhodococcus sp. 5G237]
MLPAEDDKSTTERQFALEVLEAIRVRQHEIRHHKLYYARIARDHGATYEEIGEALGVTGAGVRLMLKRAGEEAVA